MCAWVPKDLGGGGGSSDSNRGLRTDRKRQENRDFERKLWEITNSTERTFCIYNRRLPSGEIIPERVCQKFLAESERLNRRIETARVAATYEQRAQEREERLQRQIRRRMQSGHDNSPSNNDRNDGDAPPPQYSSIEPAPPPPYEPQQQRSHNSPLQSHPTRAAVDRSFYLSNDLRGQDREPNGRPDRPLEETSAAQGSAGKHDDGQPKEQRRSRLRRLFARPPPETWDGI